MRFSRTGDIKLNSCIEQDMINMRWCIVTIVLHLLCFDVLGVLGDVGTATTYNPPYLPTKCKGNDQHQFPEDGYFAAVSIGLWDNGAACGRSYRVRCISGLKRPCKTGSLTVQVVDLCRRRSCKSTLVLSKKAFSAISIKSKAKINVEYTEV